jgi:hypothetical protein
MIIQIYIIMKSPVSSNSGSGNMGGISIEDILFPQLENRPS